jgi:hypothetical protein
VAFYVFGGLKFTLANFAEWAVVGYAANARWGKKGQACETMM